MSQRADDTSDKSEQEGHRFDQWQYDFVKLCVEKRETGG